MRKIRMMPLLVAVLLAACAPAVAWVPEGVADTWADLPAPVRALLPGGEAYVLGFYNAGTYYVLMEAAGQVRTIYVLQPAGEGYCVDLESVPLPPIGGNPAWVGSTGTDYLYLIYDEGRSSFNFGRQHDGRWLLTGVQTREMFALSPLFGLVPLDGDLYGHCLPGKMPEFDLATLDPHAFPRTMQEAVAMVDTDGYAMVRSDVRTDRLHLRASPSKQAASHGCYYSGTPVRVHAIDGDWAKVDVFGVEGYMAVDYLAFGRDMLAVERYFPSLCLLPEYEAAGVDVYLRPEAADGLRAGTLEGPVSWASLHILANAGDDWFHVACANGLTGYVRAEYFWEGNG